MRKIPIAAGTTLAATVALGSLFALTASPAHSATNKASALAAAGTSLFSSRAGFPFVGPITCKQETPVSYYCDSRADWFFVSVANGMATWTAVSENGGGNWGSATVAMTAAP